MAATVISDVIVPEIFTGYTMEQSVNLSAFWRSGIVAQIPQIPTLLAGGGRTFNLPFWKDSAPADEIPAEGGSPTINNITTGKQIAVRQVRLLAWGAQDLAALLAGDDPMGAIGMRVASAWAARYQANILAILEGVRADNDANDSDDLMNDIAIEDGDNAADANLIGADAIIDSAFLLGDAQAKFSAIAMHSKPYSRLAKLNLITFEPTSAQDIGFGTYLGLTVIVDDGMPTAAGSTSGTKYTSILFQRGAIAGGFSGANITETEIDRDPSLGTGVDKLYTRRQFAFHPAGFAYQSPTLAGEFPVNTELDDAATWDRVYSKKNTGVVFLITNG